MLRNLNNPADRYLGTIECGTLGSSVPSTGTAGPAYCYPLVQADSALLTKQVRGKLVTLPTHGALVAYDDSSFTYTPSQDGTDFFTFQPYANGALYGDVVQVNLVSGAVVSSSFVRRNLQALRALGF